VRVLALMLCLMLVASPTSAGYRTDLLAAVNEVRADHGKRALPRCWRLMRVAQRRARSMADNDYFGHVSPAGVTAGTLLRRLGIRRAWGEAIAWTKYYGVAVPLVVRWWHSSSPHHKVLMGRWRCAGTGVSQRGAVTYYVLVVA
jgi:uncharacterized protein YkwD